MNFSVVVLLLSLAHADKLLEITDPYSCGSCCSAFDVCDNPATSGNLDACLKLLPRGCNVTSTVHISMTVASSKVCPALANQRTVSGHVRDHYEASEEVASDYVTFSTSDLVFSTQWGRFSAHLIVSDVLWTKQDGCSYSMVAHSGPADFPTVCSSPKIDATTKNTADVDLTPLASAKGFTLHLNSKLPLTGVDYISVKATGDSCTPFTLRAPPTINATIPITVTTTGEVVAVANFTAISTDRKVELTAVDDPSTPFTALGAGITGSGDPSTPFTITGADITASEESTSPSTVSGADITGSGDSFTSFTVPTVDSSVSADSSTSSPASVDSSTPSVFTEADITASGDSSSPFTLTGADITALRDAPSPFTDTGADSHASADSANAFTIQSEHDHSVLVPIAVTDTGVPDSQRRPHLTFPRVRLDTNDVTSFIAHPFLITLFVSFSI